jgi:hypothetical protein
VALGQYLSESFGFLLSLSFHRCSIFTHVSSGGGQSHDETVSPHRHSRRRLLPKYLKCEVKGGGVGVNTNTVTTWTYRLCVLTWRQYGTRKPAFTRSKLVLHFVGRRHSISTRASVCLALSEYRRRGDVIKPFNKRPPDAYFRPVTACDWSGWCCVQPLQRHFFCYTSNYRFLQSMIYAASEQMFLTLCTRRLIFWKPHWCLETGRFNSVGKRPLL